MLKVILRRLRGEEVVKQPNNPIPRHACPFYGFAGFFGIGVLMDQRGNQCALITDSYSPCGMEVRNKIPQWEKCEMNAPISPEQMKMLEKFRFAAREFWPEGQSSWSGITFVQWVKYVMDPSMPRPQ